MKNPLDKPWRQTGREHGRGPGIWVVVVLATAMSFVSPVPPGVAQQPAAPTVVRIDGSNRYETAAEVASRFSRGVDRVFLATGENFPDSLAAGPIAGRDGYPLLLVEPGHIPEATIAQLERLEPDGITILGGRLAVSRAVEIRARQYTSGTVDRLAGNDRYGTAAAIVDEYVDGPVSVAYVATGTGFVDALAGGPAAVVDDAPLLLVERDAIPAATRSALRRLDPGRIVVLGGELAVSTAVETALAGFTDGDVNRLAGGDRYETTAAIVHEVFPGTRSTVYMATGQAFPDALTGGVLAGVNRSPLVTVRRDCVPDVVLAEIERLDPDRLVVFGGVMAVSEDAANLVSCSSVADPQPTTIQTGLAVPWDVVFTPDGRTFLTERDTGRLLERFANSDTEVVLTLPVEDGGEGGLLGLAVSPRWSSDGWLYAMYVSSTDQRIVRFHADGSGLETVVTGLPDGDPGSSTHFGGRIEFGPDGMLYVAVGDTRDEQSAQDIDALSGKILRYTPDGDVPADNPFDNPVWAYGLRDPQGMAWDGAGRMYATEFGPDRDDEINRIRPGDNFGWPEVIGYDGGDSRYVDPLVVRQPSQASWSGASIMLDGAVPAWEGDLFVAGLRGQRLYRIDLRNGAVVGVETLLVGEYGRLRHVTQAPDGSLWILTNNRDGRGDPRPGDDRIVRLGP